mgnify:CR=1 FL=1
MRFGGVSALGASIQRFDAATVARLICTKRPNVLVGKFEETYLEVPPECLILTMKANQKYFPLLDKSGKLTTTLHEFSLGPIGE